MKMQILIQLSFLILLILSYFPIYYNRNISFGIKSFIFYTINVLILYLYIITISIVLFTTNKTHIYLDDLSKYAQIKYLIFVFMSIIIGCFYFIIKTTKIEYLTEIFNKISYPYLKEQTCEVLRTFTNGSLGNISDYILEKNYSNIYFKYYFFMLHFLFICGIRILRIVLLVNFTFLGGDLRYLLLLLPLLCLSWITQHWDYYFNKYLTETMDYSRKIFSIKIDNVPEMACINYNKEYVKIYWDNLSICLTDFAYTEGYLDTQVDLLKLQWLKLADFSWIYFVYKNKIQLVNKFLLITQIVCWIYIVIYFYA